MTFSPFTSTSTRTLRNRLRRSTGAIPPTGLVIIGVASVQLGSAVAKGLFSAVGPGGAACLRVALAALFLLALWRPRLGGHAAGGWTWAVVFGLAVAAMNFSFYMALDRIPLGVAVTLEFVGPLGVAVAGSRRALDLLWVILAATGILLLAPWGGASLNGTGMVFALMAGACWAMYIYLSAEVGRLFPDGSGLALAMTAGGLALLPVGILGSGSHLVEPRSLLLGVVVGLLSSVIPYSLELEALRSLPTRVFGVLMSLEPAVAALIGFLLLHQVLGVRAVMALGCVTVASFGAARGGGTAPID